LREKGKRRDVEKKKTSFGEVLGQQWNYEKGDTSAKGEVYIPASRAYALKHALKILNLERYA
jgi:hypothetical protein